MYGNEQGNDIIKNFIKSEIETKAHGETNIGTNKNAVGPHEATAIGNYSGTASTSSTSSTDSGVSISDNDEIPIPSPTSSRLHSLSASTSSSETNAVESPSCKKLNKNIKTTNEENNVNNCKVTNVNNKSYISIVDNDVDRADVNDDIISRNFDNKFSVLHDSSKGDNNTRYQSKQNITESRNVLRLNQRRNLTATPTPTTAITNNDKTSLLHNEFINQHHRPPSPPISLSSITISYDDSPQSIIHQCSASPIVSIRSISSIIITSDSDSDLNSDSEHYVIKKIGTQLTYSSNDPDIPKINKGHTVLNQKVIPNAYQEPLPALATLAAIGDSIGAAQALGTVPSISTAAQRPQIGSIALNNSSDVTFGDKYFYEGPVTIQQFLIDGHNKWKEGNDKDNPSFVNECDETSTNNTKDIYSPAAKSSKLYDFILKHKKLIAPTVLAFTTLLIVAIVLGSKALNDSKSKLLLGSSEESRNIMPIKSTIAKDNVGGGYVLRIVPRVGWLSQPPVNPWVQLNHPVERVIVLPTRTSECETQAACTYTVRITQTYNIESQQQDDIIYNFLIGGDGNVYEGRGWDNRGSVVKGYNDDSLSFAYIGSFKKQPPSYKQLNVTKLLLLEGVRLKKLSPNYKIVGANKLDPTSVATAADALYKSFESWPHWSDK